MAEIIVEFPCVEALPPRHARACIGVDVGVRRGVTVGECLQKRNNLILFLVRERRQRIAPRSRKP